MLEYKRAFPKNVVHVVHKANIEIYIHSSTCNVFFIILYTDSFIFYKYAFSCWSVYIFLFFIFGLQTALHLAAQRNQHLIVADLISLGANVNARDQYGKTCLHLSAEFGYIRVLEV